MKCAADFREMAREALRGKWLPAAGTGFVASLIGATIATAGGGSGGSSSSSSGSDIINNYGDGLDSMLEGMLENPIWQGTMIALAIGIVLLLVWGIVTLVIGGAGQLGYATYNLNLIDKAEARFKDLFSQFHRLGDGFCMKFFMGLYSFLWSLLFVIPGIVKRFSYAMTPYILAENPGMTANEAITQSRHIMKGNKWRLFCLGISFIGWNLLCMMPSIIAITALGTAIIVTENLLLLFGVIPAVIPSVIGMFFLRPYMEAARAAFYRDLVGEPNVIRAENGAEVWMEF